MQYNLTLALPPAPPRLPGLIRPTWHSLGPLAKFMPKFHIALATCRLTAGKAGKNFHHIRADTGNTCQCLAMTAQLSRQNRQILLKCLRNPVA
jgi:hypothetical protein